MNKYKTGSTIYSQAKKSLFVKFYYKNVYTCFFCISLFLAKKHFVVKKFLLSEPDLARKRYAAHPCSKL